MPSRSRRLAGVGLLGVAVVFAWLAWRGGDGVEPPLPRSIPKAPSAWALPIFLPPAPGPTDPTPGESEHLTNQLTVLVVDVTGGPIAGTVIATEFTRIGATDSAGKYTFDSVSAGLPIAGELTASAVGYGTQTKFYASPGTVIFKLIPQSRIAGHVVEKVTGNPVPGVAVDIGDAALAESDADGRFTILDVPPGSYRVRGRNKLWYGILEAPVALGPASVVGNLRLEVSRGFVIRGKVLANEVPVPKQEVLGGDTAATTNETGEYQLNAVPPGEYTLEVRGGEPNQGFYMLNSSVRVTVLDRDVTADINLGPRATVAFVVVDRAGRPQGGIGLDVRQKNPRINASSECRTNKDGTCTLEGAVPGLMLARVSASVPYSEIMVPTKDNEPVRFVMEDGVHVSGRIVRADGGAVGKRYILLGATGGSDSYSIRSQADGTFRFERVVAGTYEIQVRGDSIFSRDDTAEAKQAVSVKAGQDVRDLLLELPPEDQSISGTVLREDGMPTGDVLVACQRTTGTMPEDRAVTDIAGRFRCENLRRGHAYHLTAYSPEGASSDLEHVPASARDVVLRLKNLVSLHVNVEGVADGDQPAVFLKRDDGKILWPGSTMGGHHFVGLEPGGYSIVRFGLGGEEQQLRKIQIDSRPRQEISLAPN